MEKRRKREMRKEVSHICFLLLLALLQTTTPSSALGYRTLPANITVALGDPAVFRCGVPKSSQSLTFTINGRHVNHSLTCPDGNIKDVPQALFGTCEAENGELLAVWTIKGASYFDNGTRVVCQQPRNPDAPAAVLHVYDSGVSHATLIGCTIGGFFGILLVFGLSFTMLQRSQTLRNCFRGKRERQDDTTTIVTKE